VNFFIVLPGQTVKKQYSLKVMERLRMAVRRKRPDLWWGNVVASL
jgi:hypothetical protein